MDIVGGFLTVLGALLLQIGRSRSHADEKAVLTTLRRDLWSRLTGCDVWCMDYILHSMDYRWSMMVLRYASITTGRCGGSGGVHRKGSVDSGQMASCLLLYKVTLTLQGVFVPLHFDGSGCFKAVVTDAEEFFGRYFNGLEVWMYEDLVQRVFTGRVWWIGDKGHAVFGFIR